MHAPIATQFITPNNNKRHRFLTADEIFAAKALLTLKAASPPPSPTNTGGGGVKKRGHRLKRL